MFTESPVGKRRRIWLRHDKVALPRKPLDARQCYELNLFQQMPRRCIGDLPAREATEYAAHCTSTAYVEPAYLLVVLIKREANSDIGLLRVAVDALPMLWPGLVPVFFAVAQEVLRRAFDATTFGHSLIVVSVKVKGIRPTRASRKAEIMNLIPFGGIHLKEAPNIGWLRTNPPFP